jgi:hypothetical protein
MNLPALFSGGPQLVGGVAVFHNEGDWMHSVRNASLGGTFSLGLWAQPLCEAGTVCMLMDTRGDNGRGALLGLMPPAGEIGVAIPATTHLEPYFYPSPRSPGSNMGSGLNVSDAQWSYIGVSVTVSTATGWFFCPPPTPPPPPPTPPSSPLSVLCSLPTSHFYPNFLSRTSTQGASID